MRASFCVLILCLFTAPLWAQTETDTEKLRPKLITGQVVDQHGKAVDGASVKALISTYIRSTQKYDELANVTLTTDEKGEFSFEVKKSPPENSMVFLNATVGSKIHFRRDFHFGDDKLWKETVELGSLKITKGVRVTGQLASPDAGAELQNPAVSLTAKVDNSYFNQFINCDADGRFDGVVPAGCKLKVSISSENFAFSELERKIDAPKIAGDRDIPEFDLGELRLKQGVSVVGSAKLKDGRPASGIVIGIVERKDREGQDEVLHVSSAKTDSKGNFQLPPHVGKCTIYALKLCRSRAVVDGQEQMLKSDREVPFYDPVELDLDDKGPELTIEMVEADTVTITGTVIDAKGNPMAEQPVTYSWVTRFGVIEQDRTKTDEDGQYSFPFGKGRKLSMRLFNQKIANSGYEFFLSKRAAFVFEDLVLGESSGIDDFAFNAIDQDLAGLDWEVRKTGPRGGTSLMERAGDFGEWMLFGDQ